MANISSQNFHPATLNQAANGSGIIKIYVANAVKDKIARHSPVIFERNFHKNVFGHPGSVVNKSPGILNVFQHVAEDSKIELLFRERQVVSIKELYFAIGDFLFLDFAHSAGRNFQARKLRTETGTRKLLKDGAVSATNFQNVRMLEVGAKTHYISGLVDAANATPLRESSVVMVVLRIIGLQLFTY